MNRCIFHNFIPECQIDLDEYAANEHIILSCLGARKQTKKVLCKNCEQYLSNNLDTVFADNIKTLRSVLGIRNHDKPGHKIPSVNYDSSIGEVKFNENTVTYKGKPFKITEERRTGDTVTFNTNIKGNNKEEFERNLNDAYRCIKSQVSKNYDQSIADSLEKPHLDKYEISIVSESTFLKF
jgi:hypothetical protein